MRLISALRNQLTLSSICGADFLKIKQPGRKPLERGFESRVVRCLGVLVDLPLFCDEGHSVFIEYARYLVAVYGR